MTATIDGCLTFLRSQAAVQGICRCGSYRQGINDAVSDLDIWVFCHDAAALSEDLVISTFLPDDARCEVLFEGRDETLVEYLVLNVLADGVVLNLKFLHTSVFGDFCGRDPNLDVAYLEDLENYTTMDVQHDPGGVIAAHLAQLHQDVVSTTDTWFVPQITARYAATYWRSVYQGVLREEEHPWRHLVTTLLELLTWLDYLNTGQLPPARKWLFSTRLLTGLPSGQTLSALLDTAHRTQVDDQTAVLEFYRRLATAEDAIFAGHHLEFGYWWRAVFTERIPHLAAAGIELGPLPDRLAAAGLPEGRS